MVATLIQYSEGCQCSPFPVERRGVYLLVQNENYLPYAAPRGSGGGSHHTVANTAIMASYLPFPSLCLSVEVLLQMTTAKNRGILYLFLFHAEALPQVGCPRNSADTEFRLFFLLPSIPYSVRNWLQFRRNSVEFRVV